MHLCEGALGGGQGRAGRAGRAGELQPHQSMPRPCVQAVSNKLLNSIKRSGIILQGPEGPWTAVVNTLLPDNDTVVLAAVAGTIFSKIQLGAGATATPAEG